MPQSIGSTAICPAALARTLEKLPWFRPAHEAIITTLGWTAATHPADTEASH